MLRFATRKVLPANYSFVAKYSTCKWVRFGIGGRPPFSPLDIRLIFSIFDYLAPIKMLGLEGFVI